MMNSEFFTACQNGDKDKVVSLLANSLTDVNQATDEGATPFYFACEGGYNEVVKLFLADARVDVNQGGNDGITPFASACCSGHKEVVELLLADQRVDVNQAHNGGATPFYFACERDYNEVVALLLADARVDVNQEDKDGITPFLSACREGHKEVVELLLADPRGDVNKAANDGRTPFFTACQLGHDEIVALLLADARVDVNKATVDDYTPFCIACGNGHNEVIALLLADLRVDVNQEGPYGPPLYSACDMGRYDIVALLLDDSRVDVNQEGLYGSTPFLNACSNGRNEIVELLLADPRVDVNQVCDSSGTPFFYACSGGHQDVVALLLNDPRVDVNQKPMNDDSNLYNKSPFCIAFENGHNEVVALLLADARVDADVTKALYILYDKLQQKKIVSDLDREMLKVLFTAGFKRNSQLLSEKNSGDVLSTLIDLNFDEVDISANELEGSGLTYYLSSLQESSRKEVQKEFAASLYALAIFYTDDYLQSWSVEGNTRRFFDILKRLPLELHMLVCNRYTGLSADIIARVLSEQAFRSWIAIFNQEELSSVFKIAVFKKIYAALEIVLSLLNNSVALLPEEELTRNTLYQAAQKNPLITRAWLLTQTHDHSQLSENEQLINEIIPQDLSQRAELTKAVVKKLS